MDKQEQYLQWVINDIIDRTYLKDAPTQVMFGGEWRAFPEHFYNPPTADASIFKTLARFLSLNYGLTQDEVWVIVDEVYPWIVDNLLSDYTRIR